ncbi:MAG TPA: hypothetical protein VNA19_15375 [Pyrinomonadaceae bacterium]|nr:hypothetical protein [Pyrinomonadaceae bacterium]
MEREKREKIGVGAAFHPAGDIYRVCRIEGFGFQRHIEQLMSEIDL